MAEEQLNLIDNISPSLRRIYQEAEKLNRRILSLRSKIKTLEKPASLSYMRKELKSVENQAKQTERALKAMKGAEALNAKFGAFTVGSNGSYYLNGMRIKNAQMAQMAEAYSRNVALNNIRRNRLLWDTGRLVNGLTFDERLARNRGTYFWNNLRQRSLERSRMSGPSLLNDKFLQLAVTTGVVIGALNSIADIIHKNIIEPGDQYVGSITRVALTSDGRYAPSQMMENLYDTAMRTRADAEGTISLYNRIAMSGVRASNDRILRFVETFNKTMAISGTTANENRAVMLQLAQGMGSNRLGGDEFRSIAEQAPMFKYMLARGMGVNPGALKQMGAEGKLTAEAIMTAMEKVQDQIDEIFKTAPWTIGQLLIVLQTKWQKMIVEQLTGYIQLRDAVKDFVNWLDTAEGTQFTHNLVDMVNYLLELVLKFARFVSPFIVWIVNNFRQWTKWVQILGMLWAASKIPAILKLIGVLLGNIAWSFIGIIANTQHFLNLASTGFASLAGVLGLTVGQLGAVAAAIIAIIGTMYAFKHIKDELDPKHIQEDKRIKQARYDYERGIDNYIQSQIGPRPTYMTAAGSEVKLTPKEIKEQEEYNRKYLELSRQKKLLMNQWDADAQEGVLRKFSNDDMLTDAQKALRDINRSTEQFYGKMDSSKNIPMPVESKGGKLNSVGRIEDDVNLNTDSIQMMKALAERQWIVQNEVTVPQKVDMLVDKSTNVDPQSLAENFNQAIQLATASSMRGEAIV